MLLPSELLVLCARRAGHSIRIEVPRDDPCPECVHVYGGLFRPFNALGARQQVFFKRRQFGLIFYHSKVVALKIVIGNMLHIGVVEKRPENSQEKTSGLVQMGLSLRRTLSQDRAPKWLSATSPTWCRALGRRSTLRPEVSLGIVVR